MIKTRYYTYAAALVVVFLTVVSGLFYTRERVYDQENSDNSFVIDKSEEDDNNNSSLQAEPTGQLDLQIEPTQIQVHILGAVKNPGVYELDPGSRVNDALFAAGGETDEADLLRVNLADYIVDAQQIYIPQQGEEFVPAPVASQSVQNEQANSGLININTASANELATLPGIGDTMADAIIRYREQNGLFKRPDDIKNVSRIGDKTYDALKDLITVD